MTATATAPAAYAIRVRGHLDDHWSVSLAGLSVTRNSDDTSTLAGPIADQAQLHGVLAGLRDIGATLLALHSTDQPLDDTPNDAPPTRTSPVLKEPLHSERLTLRPAHADDADATWRFRELDSVNKWLTGCPADLDGYRDLFADPERLATTVVIQLGHEPDAAVIGDFMVRRRDAWAQLDVTDQARDTQAELGWVLDPVHNGQGYATEAVTRLLRYCFNDLGVRRVVANSFLDNDTSWRLMERVGMRREAHAVRESLHRSGKWLDTVAYALLYDEWRDEERGNSPRQPNRT
jgi:RimJ/RimL family protein N-acetyltransferase